MFNATSCNRDFYIFYTDKDNSKNVLHCLGRNEDWKNSWKKWIVENILNIA